MKGDEVRIRRQGSALILEPVASDWAWLEAISGEFSSDFFADGLRWEDWSLQEPAP